MATRIEHFFLGALDGAATIGIHFFYISAVVNVPLNEWVHMGMTYDGITQRLYMNGEELTFQDVGWPISADDTPFTIGAGINETWVEEFLPGLVDEVHLYDIDLRREEMTALACGG